MSCVGSSFAIWRLANSHWISRGTGRSASGAASSPSPIWSDMNEGCVLVQRVFRAPYDKELPTQDTRVSAQCGVPARRRHAASGNGRAPPLAPGRALVRYDQLRPFVPAMNAVSVFVVAIDQDRPAVVAEEPGSDMLSDTPIPPVTAAAARASTRRNRRGPRRVATGFAGAAMTNSLSLVSTTLC